jgi:spore maturation protein CgeB
MGSIKKVLIIGPYFYGYNESIERGFQKNGCVTKVISFGFSGVVTKKDRISYILSKEREKFLTQKDASLNQKIYDTYEDFKPDLIFIIYGARVDSAMLSKFKCKKALWLMDSINRIERLTGKNMMPLVKAVEYNFFFENTDVESLWESEKIKSWFLPLALDEKVYYPMNKPKQIDILFVGSMNDERLTLLRNLVDRFKDKRIKIYGSFFAPLFNIKKYLFRKDKKVFTNKNIHPSKVNALYATANICINVHRSQTKCGANQRFFELSGSKAFQLVDNNPFITDNFSNTEVVTYSNQEDLFDKIQYFLDNELERNSIVENIYQKVIGSHKFSDRVKFVLNTITENEN